MWNVSDQRVNALGKYRLPLEFNERLGKASMVFGAPEEEILAQALREFLEKHGIRTSIHPES
ncbi:MAG: hypothetical protein FJY97_00395 [candidate division Zixibacteria bacterium]|nr:hypothetical protein [candidate division Zixibacteria bacterium]